MCTILRIPYDVQSLAGRNVRAHVCEVSGVFVSKAK